MLSMIRTWRFVGAALVAGALSTGAYAFTASNTVPASNAGSGNGAISGYTITAVAYVLNASNAISSTTFTLNAAATTVKAKIVTTDSYTTCSIVGGTAVTCAYGTPVSVVSADQLDVIATS